MRRSGTLVMIACACWLALEACVHGEGVNSADEESVDEEIPAPSPRSDRPPEAWPRPPAPRDPEVTLEALPPAKTQKAQLEWMGCFSVPMRCADVARKYEVGFGEPPIKDLEVAAALFALTCHSGEMRACAQLGAFYIDGAGVAVNGPVASYYLDRACRDGNKGAACANLGMVYRIGFGGVQPDEEHAQALFRRACAMKVKVACDSLIDRDQPKSQFSDGPRVTRIPDGADVAEVTRPTRIAKGTIQELVPDAARRALPTAARAQFAMVETRCNSIGCLTSNAEQFALPSHTVAGEVFEHDDALATALYEEACAKGHAVSCARVADAFGQGRGVPQDSAQQAALLARACYELRPPSPGACTDLGAAFVLGLGVAQDTERARECFSIACEMGDLGGCRSLQEPVEAGGAEGLARSPSLQAVPETRVRAIRPLVASCENAGGRCHRLGLGLLHERPPAYLEAAAFFEQACVLEVPQACATLGSLLWLGRGVKQDRGRAVPLLEKACDAGVASACSNVGVAELEVKALPSDRRAADAFSRACNGKDAGGCANLGWMRERGRGGKRDLGDAKALYEKACELGSLVGCRNLGAMLVLGRGIPAEPRRAAALFEQGCAKGDGLACVSLASLAVSRPAAGVKFQAGVHIPVLDSACGGGDARACLNLGYVFDQGLDTRRDAALAAQFFTTACRRGQALGCSNAAVLYQDGTNGVGPNPARALAFFTRACELGLKSACGQREIVLSAHDE